MSKTPSKTCSVFAMEKTENGGCAQNKHTTRMLKQRLTTICLRLCCFSKCREYSSSLRMKYNETQITRRKCILLLHTKA